MEHGFSILMLIFGAAILLYASIMYISKDPMLLPKSHASKKSGGKYVRQVARVVALVSLAPIASGIVGLREEKPTMIPVIVLITGFVVLIGAGVQMLKDEDDETQNND